MRKASYHQGSFLQFIRLEERLGFADVAAEDLVELLIKQPFYVKME